MTKEWLSLLSSVDKIRSEFLVAVAGSSLFLLFSPPRLLQALGLLEAIGRIRTWLGITLLISACLIVTRATGLALRYVGQEIQLWKAKKSIHQLSGEELGFLGEFIERDVASIRAPVGDGTAGALMAKRLIFQASSIGDALSGFAYCIQPWVKDYLLKRTALWITHTAKTRKRKSPPRSRPEF